MAIVLSCNRLCARALNSHRVASPSHCIHSEGGEEKRISCKQRAKSNKVYKKIRDTKVYGKASSKVSITRETIRPNNLLIVDVKWKVDKVAEEII